MSNIFSIILKNMKLWLGIAILAVFLWKIDFDFSIMRTIDTAYFSIAVLLLLANVSVRVLRWDKISRIMLKKTLFLQNSKIFFLGQALNELAPQGTGEVTKAYLSYKSYGQKGRSFLIPVFERMIDIFALLIASFFVVFLLPVDFSRYGGAIIFVLFAFLFASVFFMKPKYLERIVRFFIRKITKNRKDIEKNTMNWRGVKKRDIVVVFLITCFSWLVEAIAQSYLLQSFGYSVSFITLLSIIAFSIILAIPTFLPGGIGAREITYSYFLSLVGVPIVVSVSAAVVWRGVYWLALLVFAGGSYFTFDSKKEILSERFTG